MQIGQLFLWNNFPYPKDNSQVTNEKLKLIYKKLLQTGISKKIKHDIHQCLNSAGVTGLKRP